MPEITEKSKVDVAKQVIFMYYNLLPALIVEKLSKKIKIDEKGLPVTAIPGKQVTTKAGAIIRGIQQTGDNPTSVYIQRDDLAIEIPRADILTIQDVDLSKGVKMVPPTFEELKAYVTDSEGGLGGDLVARISQSLGITPAEVKEIWENRFVQTAVVRDSVLVKSPVYTRTNKAFYHKGSWLRHAGTGGSSRTNISRLVDRTGSRRSVRNQYNRLREQRDKWEEMKKKYPELSDDPEVWWKVQAHETKQRILRAFAAESIYKVKEIQGKVCPECAGKGYIVSGNEQIMCNFCRGLKTLAVVIYE